MVSAYCPNSSWRWYMNTNIYTRIVFSRSQKRSDLRIHAPLIKVDSQQLSIHWLQCFPSWWLLSGEEKCAFSSVLCLWGPIIAIKAHGSNPNIKNILQECLLGAIAIIHCPSNNFHLSAVLWVTFLLDERFS